MKKIFNKRMLALVIPVLLIVLLLWLYRRNDDAVVAKGETIYLESCANCHGKDGKGLRGLIPPLGDPAFLEPDRLACIIRYGLSGPITVNGKVYNQPMQPNPELEEDEITAVINYISLAFGDSTMKATLPGVTAALRSCR